MENRNTNGRTGMTGPVTLNTPVNFTDEIEN